MNSRARLLVVTLITAACAPTARAFDKLFVFGDSLSDVGNVRTSSGTLVPGQFYFNGRFSNGANFTEALSSGLGLGGVSNSLAGGNNYAYGGARATGTTGFPAAFIRDVDQQVTQYLTVSPTADAQGLYVVYAGANDLNQGQTNVNVPVNSLAESINRLYAAGARTVLAPNLPPLGLVPRYNGNAATAAAASNLTRQFNAALETALQGLESAHPDLRIYRLDVATLFTNVVADHAAYGLTNVTMPAAPGLQPGDQTYNTALLAPNPDQYLFWDDLHPTRAGHALLGQATLAAVPEPTVLTLVVLGGMALLRRRHA